MRLVVVMDCDWQALGNVAAAFEAAGCEPLPFQSGLRALAYCERPDSPLDAVFINLNNSGPGAGLWLGDQIARARPGVPVGVTSFVFRNVPNHMPRTITLWRKPVTREMIHDVAAGRQPAPLPPVTLRITMH